MKKCKSCKQEIDDKATKCPHCQADQRNWFGRHKIMTGVLGFILLIIIISASSSSKGVNTSPSSSTSATSSNADTKTATAHVGAGVDVGGKQGLNVTLVQVIDPATSDNQYSSADAGKRYVGLSVKIVNNGTASYTDDANNNLTLIGSDNQSYTSDVAGINGCTNFSNGQYTLAAGDSATGCVNYQLPNGVKPVKAQFTSNSGFSGSTGQWLIP
ncbi:MAG TPA: DUF4352 domain-containing protein [Candidatus Saccharimonadia bacterium]